MTREGQADEITVAPERPRIAFGRHAVFILLGVTGAILAAITLAPELFGEGRKYDYALWYWAGRQVLTGGDLYAPDQYGTLPFLYPRFAALLLVPFCLFGRAFSVLCIVLVYLASWWAALILSDRLSGESRPKPWWVAALPSAILLPIIGEMFNLGQPNLMLLAMMLAGLALLQSGRAGSAGAMFALATALKAYPVAILPYLLGRRQWRAAAAMTICIGVFLLIAPAPFRGFERNLQEVKTWSQGMIWSANQDGFGQRLELSWSWKNNSLMAVTQRLLRPLNAEATDPLAKPTYVNVLNLSYRQANLVLLAVACLIGVGFCAVLPPERRRLSRSDAMEFALLLSLMTIASPLARSYYFIWLLFPITVVVYRAALEPNAKVRLVTWSLLALAAILGAAPFWEAGTGLELRAICYGRPASSSAPSYGICVAPSPQRLAQGSPRPQRLLEGRRASQTLRAPPLQSPDRLRIVASIATNRRGSAG